MKTGLEKMDAAQLGATLIKQLAASDNKTRNRSLRILIKTWLPSQSQISDDEMKKIWKGLFYCVWHTDKLPSQTYLIDCLSSLLADLPLPLSIHYLSVFCLTMRREWSGIDALRLDKFYLLIRRFLHFFFVFLKKNSWDIELSARMMGVLVETTFLAHDKFQGNGVNYHIASVFLEELKPFLPLRKQVLEILLIPFGSVMATVLDKVLVSKIKINVFDELLKMGKQFLEVNKLGSDINFHDHVGILGSIALALGFSSKFYELGCSAECHQGNRKMLLGLHEEFLKLEKELASSGISILIPEANNNTDNDEVPMLIPLANELEMSNSNGDAASGSDTKPAKRCKKIKLPSSGNGKKSKRKKNAVSDLNTERCSTYEENENVALPNCENADDEISGKENLVTFCDSVISNLQMQFEKVAAEAALENSTSTISFSKKRKRAKARHQSENPELTVREDGDGGANAKSGEKSAKKVRFSMKSNLVWKPHSPLPPQSLRLPPSVTPRGSALKKGIPAGPIREISPATKKVKKAKLRAKSLKKGRKGMNVAIKQLKKLKSISI